MPHAESVPPDLPGLIFVRPLGTGGYAEVFLYEQANTHMRVAVKVLFKDGLTDRAREQFAAEANAMAELAGHPNIVQVFGADVTSDGRPYLVMKHYPQRNLAVRARAEQLSVDEVLEVGVRISCAVETAHRAGILHRDIKPANILTSQYGEPGLTDFGIATRSSGEADEESQGLSIPWSAPEVVFATSPGDKTADVYSLGATLWHLLAGHSPFEDPRSDNSRLALMRRIREKPVPRTGRNDVPPSLERLLAQTMAKKPADRPQSALAVARSLQAIEAEERFAPTPLVLLAEVLDESDDNPGGQSEWTEARDGATRRREAVPTALPVPLQGSNADDLATIRKAVVVSGVSSPPVATPTGAARSPRVRQGMVKAPDPTATVRRPAVVTPGVAPPDPDLSKAVEPDRSNAWRLAILSLVVIGVFVGIAVALSGGGGKKGSANPPPSGQPPVLPVVAPDPPIVAGNRVDATHLQFGWTPDSPATGVSYYWKEQGGPLQAATGTSVTVTTLPSQQACITVEVVRGSTFADSKLTCVG